MIEGNDFPPNSSEIDPYVVNQNTCTDTGNRDLNVTLNAAYMHSAVSSNGAYVDLKAQDIREIPTNFCDIFKNVQYLYLEQNSLEELPEDFLPSLPFLKWLDVRNNLLHSIPMSIAHHPTLETLLLQENRITKLPLELGMVPKLRGIQLKGNPITYPPQEIIHKGLKALLEFLKSEMEIKSPIDIQPVSELFYQNTKPSDAEEKKLSRKLQSKSCTNNSVRSKKSFQYPSHILALKSSQMSCVGNKKPLYSNNKIRPKFLNQTSICDEFPSSFNEMQLPDGECFTTEEKLLFPLRQKPSAYEIKMINREEKIQENFMKEMWICKLRDMLEQQGKIIQRRKDQEILNGWRMDYRRSQSIPKFRKHDFSAPYEINSDLYMDGTEKPQPLKREEKPREIGEEMAEIYRSLQCLSGSKLEDNLCPKSKQLMLDKEMQQLAKLQKQLTHVQKRNTIEYQMLKDSEKQKRPHARKSAPNLKFTN